MNGRSQSEYMNNIALLFLLGASALAAERASVARAIQAPVTLAGRISDSLCKAKHEEAAEGQGKMPDRDCTLACVRGGSKYVLVADGKVYQIANQTFGDLATHAGHTVRITGELKGDAITVATIEKN
jgi:hypothetical protein